MEIIDLSDEYEGLFCKCLEDWSDEMQEVPDLKKAWLDRKRLQGFRAKLARTEDNQIVGMIQYIPIEHAPALGKNLYYIYCIWVHGYPQGVGNYQKQGIGSQLLAAAEADARDRGSSGMVAWGLRIPVFMRSKWFKKHGYQVDVAGDGKKALQALENNDYELVLMDCMMPEMNGYEVTAVIRDPASAVRRHDIPVIALTGNVMKQDRERCIAVGMNDHLAKPLLLPALLAMLDKWLNRDIQA